MILQPVVENALYYGIKKKKRRRNDYSKGYIQQDNIVFEVKDNGIGMEEQTLENLRKKLREIIAL